MEVAMADKSLGLPLCVHVPADDWAYAQRRQAYLEAVLVQVLNDRGSIREWYDAAELAGLLLPGLPHSKAGITRVAGNRGWPRREESGRGGIRFLYHYSSFPARAFDALISRIVDVPPPPADAPPVPETPPAAQPAIPVENTAPPWVLPFMRLLRGDAGGNLASAWAALPDHLPQGVDCPTQEDAAVILVNWGLVPDC
jgi:hypothetical protein